MRHAADRRVTRPGAGVIVYANVDVHIPAACVGTAAMRAFEAQISSNPEDRAEIGYWRVLEAPDPT